MAKNPAISKLISRISSRLPARQQEGEKGKKASKPPSLKLVFFIIDSHRIDVLTDVFIEEKVRFHFISMAKGTASSDIVNLLGIGTGEKAVVICLEQAVGVPVLMKEARKKLMQKTPGAGIAFSISLSAINDPALLVFKQSIHKNEKVAAELDNKAGSRSKSEGGKMVNPATHDLIISIVNQGYSDDFMNTAREAGASGGTVLNARGQAHEGAVKFFGISVQEEKEIILILSPREKKVEIMQAVCEAHGLNSKAHGIVFSLPVDNVMGLNFE